MNITFKLKYSNEKEKELCDDFCRFVVTSISHEIINNSNVAKIKALSDEVLSVKWISWIDKPVYLDPRYLLALIANSVYYEKLRDGSYKIGIDQTTCYPGSRTKLERFVRFLDKGNLSIRGSYVFTGIFTKYTEQLINLWKMYKSNKLKTYDIENSFVIK